SGPAKRQWNVSPISRCLQATAWNPRYIGGSWTETGDPPPCRWLNLCLPSLLLCIGEPTVVCRYHSKACRCFAGAADS
ncbi:hypothetical protein HAX54_006651, partial [Datura stramonium]|nr:hypothetical protein [Datura stramonium]